MMGKKECNGLSCKGKLPFFYLMGLTLALTEYLDPN